LEIRRVIVPAAAGLFSSVGLLDADEALHLVHACAGAINLLDPAVVQAAYVSLELEALAGLRVTGGGLETRRSADVRYRGQSTTLAVPVGSGQVDRPGLRAISRAFAGEHLRTYGYASRGEPVELVNVRLVATVRPDGTGHESVALRAGRGTARPADAADPATASRPAWFGDRHGWLETPLLQRADLIVPRDGPLIVEEYDATTVVPPGSRAWLDERGPIVIEVGG